jgi:hypothetical protein
VVTIILRGVYHPDPALADARVICEDFGMNNHFLSALVNSPMSSLLIQHASKDEGLTAISLLLTSTGTLFVVVDAPLMFLGRLRFFHGLMVFIIVGPGKNIYPRVLAVILYLLPFSTRVHLNSSPNQADARIDDGQQCIQMYPEPLKTECFLEAEKSETKDT